MASTNDGDGLDRLSERAAGWADSKASSLADSRHPVGWVLWRLFLAIVVLGALSVGISAITGVISFGADAAHETQHVLSVGNIVEQRTTIINDWQGLLVAVGNACNARSAPPSSNAPTLVEDPAFAYAAAARNATIDYNRRQHNLFEAELVGPPGYPRTVPDAALMDTARPDWCKISADLHRTHD